MDSSDDFEFKPLTEGLGFHKKASKIKNELKAASFEQETFTARTPTVQLNSRTESELLGREVPRPASKSISDLIASLPPSLDFIGDKPAESLTKPMPKIEPNMDLPEGSRPQIFQPFAREDFKASAPAKKPSQSMPGPMSPTLPKPGTRAAAVPVPSHHREKLNESFNRAFPQAERKKETRTEHRQSERKAAIAAKMVGDLEAVPVHFGASFLDGMVVTGMSTVLLVAIVAITRVNLVGLLTNARTDGPTQVHIALLFIACLQLYLLTARSFFGASLGEWAFDLQLGTSSQQLRSFYPLQVAWRTMVVTLTGIVTLPLLSFITRRDLAKFACGLQLFRRRD